MKKLAMMLLVLCMLFVQLAVAEEVAPDLDWLK